MDRPCNAFAIFRGQAIKKVCRIRVGLLDGNSIDSTVLFKTAYATGLENRVEVPELLTWPASVLSLDGVSNTEIVGTLTLVYATHLN